MRNAFQLQSYGALTHKDYVEHLADFWEVKCICNPDFQVSLFDFKSFFDIAVDDNSTGGLDDVDDEIENYLSYALQEIEQRLRQIGSDYYPFSIQGNSVVYNQATTSCYYEFLLFSSRLNMNVNRVQNGLNGPDLFEHFCAAAGKSYFGKGSESLVFGTAQKLSNVSSAKCATIFEKKVNELISFLGEGKRFKNRNGTSITKNDDKLDVVFVKPFNDSFDGNFIVFGQCKTGVNWRDHTKSLVPKDFTDAWFENSLAHEPKSAFFVADVILRDFNPFTTIQGSLFFSRFRILEYFDSSQLETTTQDEIRQWVQGAINTAKAIVEN